MASKGSQSSARTEYSGLMVEVPVNSTAVRHTGGRSSGGNAGSCENKSQVNYFDKQSGSYVRETATEKATAGEFQWKNGTSGNRSEYKQTETVRVSDKSGYTEVHNERRVSNVTYDNYGDKSVVNYDGGAYGRSGGSYGGHSGSFVGGGGAYGGGGGAYGGGGGAYVGHDSDFDSNSESDSDSD